MKVKKRIVFLVDDDTATNYLNNLIGEKIDYFKEILIAEDGQQALDLLKTGIEGERSLPDLILLDINMPIMNGWEFLYEYKHLKFEKKSDIKIVMMTTSTNPDDKKRASTINEVSSYKNKPLNVKLLNSIIQELFYD